ncbi:MAG: hypothetical protein HKM06_06670 [Spirochaetales bacterium]|nr:hypothetical protein [Spirochaetales bacterium]
MRLLLTRLFLIFFSIFGVGFVSQLEAQEQTWSHERKEVFPLLEKLPTWSSALVTLASAHAQDLAKRGVLSHEDAFGRNVAQRAGVLGLPEGEYGEVVGAGPTRMAVWQAWKKSPPHRELLMETGWQNWGAAEVHLKGMVICVLVEYRPEKETIRGDVPEWK